MKFDDLDRKMREFETAHDRCVPPGIFIVARVDGRSFTRLTKEVHKFEAPFDEKIRDIMIATVQHLMTCGFNAVFGFTESDEISILFDQDESHFERKTRKFQSVLAGEASAAFTLKLGSMACFDCRVSELPSKGTVIDYFRWRQEDTKRNALNSHCYWMLRRAGKTIDEATDFIVGLSSDEKIALLAKGGIDFHSLPAWQKNGIGFYWESYEKEGFNPKTGTPTRTLRRRLATEMGLPTNDLYAEFIAKLLTPAPERIY